jgi:hypothetical protein
MKTLGKMISDNLEVEFLWMFGSFIIFAKDCTLTATP